MTGSARRAGAACAVLLAGAAAWGPQAAAQTTAAPTPAPAPQSADRPPIMPTVDAAVTYEMHARGQTERLQVMFGDRGNKMRIDNPQSPGDLVFDRASQTLLVVMQQPRAYMVVPLANGQQNPFMFDPQQHFRRLGTTQTIAGVTCDDWDVSSPKGRATACVTPDGLLLAQSGADPSGVSGTLRAVSVSLAPLPPATFAPPAGYTRVAHPAVPGGAAGGPGGPG